MSKVRAVNGFKIRRFTRNDIRGIFIIYMIDDKYVRKSKYYNVEEEKIEKVKKKLKDYTSTNRETQELCRTISLETMQESVDRIMYDY